MLGKCGAQAEFPAQRFSSSTSPDSSMRVESPGDAPVQFGAVFRAPGKRPSVQTAGRSSSGPEIRKSAFRSAGGLRARAGCAGRRRAPGARPFSDPASPVPHAGRASPCSRPRVDLRADVRTCDGQLVQALGEGAVVEHRAADEQRDSSPCLNLRDRAHRVLAEASRGVALGRIDQVDQVVRHARGVRPARAWRCRCPCRGRPAPSRRSTISTGNFEASCMASRDFPLAVGPSSAKAVFFTAAP